LSTEVQATKDNEEHPADIKPLKGISKIWLVPFVALSIGLWMVYFQWSNQGPQIIIQFETASGLEAGKTKIKTRNVDIGLVEKIELKEDLSGVEVTARIDRRMNHLLVDSSKFWIESPRVSLNGVSGLSTLLSGPFITLEPGSAGKESYYFVGLNNPPVTPAGTPGLHVTLNSDDEFAFSPGDPIVYKGLKVGQFEDLYFNIEERVVYYNAFVKAPYHKLLTENTKFWNISGVKADLGANGISIQTGSLETLLSNGVTFGVPEGIAPGQQIVDRTYFDIYPDYDTASEERYKLSANFVILINETIRGLHVGAPVEYRGLEVGKVIEVNPPSPVRGLLDEGYAIPAIISIQPGRVQQPDNKEGLDFVREQTLHWIEQGFRASLKTGNILTGALYVDLSHYPNEPKLKPETYLGYDVIPTIASEFSQITQEVTEILDKLNALPIPTMSENLNTMLTDISTTAKSFEHTSGNFDSLLVGVQQQNVAEALSQSLKSVASLAEDFSSGSANYDELKTTMEAFQLTLKEIQPLLIQLNNKPNSLIFSDSIAPKLEPRAASRTTSGEQK
jgi:paraquat-inducible protein B